MILERKKRIWLVAYYAMPRLRSSTADAATFPNIARPPVKKADWKSHKPNCEPDRETILDVQVRLNGPDATQPAAKALRTTSRLLSSIPKEETYRRLIDTYRLRAADALLMGGEERGWTYL